MKNNNKSFRRFGGINSEHCIKEESIKSSEY